MDVRRRLSLAAIAVTSVVVGRAQALADAPTALTRYPTIHGDKIVFVARGNLWEVARTGGVAARLTADPGQDLMPRFSPDGKWIAYTASRAGNRDVYAMPSGGGTARRMTWHSDIVADAPTRWGPDNMVLTWTPDSQDIVFLSRRMAWTPMDDRAFAVPLAGGLATPLPLDGTGFMTYGPDGHSIAYTRIFRDFRTWKRYDGGMAQDVWTYDFATRAAVRITDWKGTDTSPMWVGRKIYFLSDRDAARRENIWSYDLDSKAFHEVTHFTDYDIEFPSVGLATSAAASDGGIVFQQGGHLWVVDLPSEALHPLAVTVPDDGTRTQARMVGVGGAARDTDNAQIVDFALAPNGKRAALSARGSIFTVPAEHGAIRTLTTDPGADEDHPAFSPDGRQVAFTTDASGSSEIAMRPAEGGPARPLTHFGTGYYYQPVFSPDGRRIAFSDGGHSLWVVGADGSAPVHIATDPIQEIHDESWSRDGRWLAFSMQRPDHQAAIWLHDMTTGTSTKVSGDFENDQMPAFTGDGKYLAFVSSRHENPTFSESETGFATVKTQGVYLATLSAAAPSAFAPRSDEAAGPVPDKPKAADGKPTPPPAAGPAPVAIDLAGLMARAVPLPIEDATIGQLDARGTRLFYLTQPPQTIEGTLPGEKTALHVFDLDARKDEVVSDDLDHDAIAADGAHVLVQKDHDYTIMETKPGGGEKHRLALGAMKKAVEPPREWAEMFEATWRLERDLFVNTRMNGVDWRHVHDAYAKLLPLVGSRDDLNYLIGQVQGELGNSHTYAGGGDDLDPTEAAPVSLLGADFALDAASGRYRLARIYPGDPSRPQYRSPLVGPGIDVHQGDYLLAVDGVELRAPAVPTSLLVDAQAPLRITVASSAGGPRHDVEVVPVKSERSLRELAWIDANRATVDRLSGGAIGYVYLSDMSALGLEQFVRQFYPQIAKQALIVDDRWNGGGFVDGMLLERLRRVLVGMGTNRERIADTIPQTLLNGPKLTLLNHFSASDGDIFPYYFRAYGLGKLVGTRSWGGVRGIRGEWKLIDGGEITVPEFSLYNLDSQWVIENHGVDPDVEVENLPGELQAGHDRQLETGVAMLMADLKAHPPAHPAPPPLLPAYPP